MWIFQEQNVFFERDLFFWHFCTLSETFPAELSELRYTSPEERFEEKFTYREVSDLCFNALVEIFSGHWPVKIAGYSKEPSSSSVEQLEEKALKLKIFYVFFNIELSAKTIVRVIKPAFSESTGTFSRKNRFWKLYNSLTFSDFESKSFGRDLKTTMYVSRRTFRGKVALFRNFILFCRLQALGEISGNFRNAICRFAKLAFFIFSGTCWGKSRSLKKILGFHSFCNWSKKHSTCLSNFHSRCPEDTFQEIKTTERNKIRLICRTLKSKLSAKNSKLNYTSPEEHFEENINYLENWYYCYHFHALGETCFNVLKKNLFFPRKLIFKNCRTGNEKL